MSTSCADSGEGFKCDRCGKVFAYKYYRDKHLKYTRCVDQGDRKFPCHLCNRSFEKRDRLRIHILHVHEKHRPHKVTGARTTNKFILFHFISFYFIVIYVCVISSPSMASSRETICTHIHVVLKEQLPAAPHRCGCFYYRPH